jgi:hypothetical protein
METVSCEVQTEFVYINLNNIKSIYYFEGERERECAGDSQRHLTVKYGHKSGGTHNQVSLRWRGPAAI